MGFLGNLFNNIIQGAAAAIDHFVPVLAPIINAVAAIITGVVNSITGNSNGEWSGNSSSSRGGGSSGSRSFGPRPADLAHARERARQQQLQRQGDQFDNDIARGEAPEPMPKRIPDRVSRPAAQAWQYEGDLSHFEQIALHG